MSSRTRPATWLRRGLPLLVACGLLLLLLGCGDDSTTAPPTDDPPSNTGIPAVPKLTNPDTDPPARSSTLSVVRKSSDFAPLIDRAYCSWLIKGYGTFESLSGGWIDCDGDWETLFTGNAWSDGSDAIPPYEQCFDGCGLLSSYCPGSYHLDINDWPASTRFVFMKNNVKDPMPNTVEWDSHDNNICRESVPIIGCTSKVHLTIRYQGTGPAIEKTPYMRRDRFWVATPWSTGAMVERTTGDESITLTKSFTTGCAKTETESFAWSLGATVGGEYKGVKAQVEGSITKTFGTSFTVTEETTTTISKTLNGEANKRTCFVLWVLFEQYSFVDGNGNPFTDPNYVFDPGFYDEGGDRNYAFRVCGMQYEIGKYVFDLETNQLVSTSFVPVR